MSPNMCSKALFLLSSLSTIYSPFVQATNTIDTNCPLLGPVYPAPTQIRSSAAVKFGQKAFEDGVRQAFATGVIDNATTSFSLRAFSASETESLFDLHYEAPGLNGSLTAGSLNADTVYRIGSLTKLVTAYAMLEQFGFGPLLDSITKHIPELAAAAKKNDPLAVSWNDVTIEALMSHMAGIARDCKCHHSFC
jgi:CubicO group peptidase (beta-lactamase class C family)